MLHPVTAYATLVDAGQIVAGPYVRGSCRRHLNDLKRAVPNAAAAKPGDIWFDAEVADDVFAFFEETLRLSEGQFEGRPFKLHISQAFIIGSLFGWLRKNDAGEIVRRFRRAYIEMGKGNGKALAIDTPIPTPDGWRTMGDLRKGDVVFDDRGQPCKVKAVSGHMFERPCYRVRFNDGAEIVADADHLWRTSALRTGLPKGPRKAGEPRKGEASLRTTAQIARTLTVGPTKSLHPQAIWNHRVDIAGSLDCAKADLSVPPYTFGVWLGDGDTDCARLTVAYEDWETVERIQAEGVRCREQKKHSETTARVGIAVSPELRALGVFGRKFIPVQYLRASGVQRLAVLQGLMDADGSIAKNGQCELTLCSSGLADDAVELITSLGFKPTRHISEAKLDGRVVGMRHRIQFWSWPDRPAFRLRRKASRLKDPPKTRAISQGRMIVGCDPVPSVPVQCITVDSPSSMFLAGREMVPTHNSPLAGGIGLFGMMADNEPGAQVYSAGATFDQASILFNDAVKMAQQSEELWEDIVATGNAKILNLSAPKYPQSLSFFRPLSREKGKTGSGPRPHFALVDELHEHPDGAVMDMLERGFKFRRQPLLLMITNSGSDRKTVCWEEHEHAAKVALGDKEDDQLFSYVCALDVQQTGKNKGKPEDPLVDPSCWVKANPLLGVTITEEYLRGVVKQARDLPGKANGILRLHFCVWTDSATAWVTREMWESLEDADMRPEQFAGKQCWLGTDLSATKDMTATAIVFEDGFKDVPDPADPGKFARKPCYALFVYTYTPQETLATRQHNDRAPYDVWIAEADEKGKAFGLTALPGSVIRYDYVAQDVIELSRDYRVQGLAYDNYLIRTFVQEFEELGMPDAERTLNMTDHPQGLSRRSTTEVWMPGSIDAFEMLILERRLRVSVNPVLRGAVAGATFYKGPTELKRFDKAKATNRIDACVASAMAIGLATQRDEGLTSVYDVRGAARASGEPASPPPSSSVYDKLVKPGDIDYNILNDPRHPRHGEMLERFYREQSREDELEGV
jgi:phage terminase large subunit-like protein